MEIQSLTKVEEQIMQILWPLEKGYINEIVDQFPEPRPARTSVSTIVRILETKGFISHHAFGRTHQYYALISKDDYKSYETRKLLSNYYDNSIKSMVSFFVKEEKLDMKDMDEILKMVDNIKPIQK